MTYITSCLLWAALSSSAEIPALFAQRPIVVKQAKAAMYHPFIEAAALTIVDVPITFVTMMIFSLILYFMVGLQASASQFLWATISALPNFSDLWASQHVLLICLYHGVGHEGVVPLRGSGFRRSSACTDSCRYHVAHSCSLHRVHNPKAVDDRRVEVDLVHQRE